MLDNLGNLERTHSCGDLRSADIGKQVTLDVTAVEQDGDRTEVTAQVGGNGFTGPSHFTFDSEGPLLARMTIRA